MNWLPNELVLTANSLEGDYQMLYSIFRRDFENVEIYLGNTRVYYQEAIDNRLAGQYPHGFTHLVTKENGGQRIIDYNRAPRLPWVRAIIEHADDPSVIVLRDSKYKPKRGLTEITYLWLEEKDFLVVLSSINHGQHNGLIINTAYTITERYTQKQLQKLREINYLKNKETPRGRLY